jgi:hypothetical protein
MNSSKHALELEEIDPAERKKTPHAIARRGASLPTPR